MPKELAIPQLQAWPAALFSSQTLWNVPAISSGLGLRTRPNADQTTPQSFAPGTIFADAVRISAVEGDAGLAVSEVQLQGTLYIPEPATAASFAMLGSLLLLRRPKSMS